MVALAACACEDVRVTRIMARLFVRVDIAFILLETVSIVVLILCVKDAAPLAVAQLLEGDLSLTFWAGFVACGLVLPFIAEVISLVGNREIPAPAAAGIAILVLAGGLCLRIAFVACGAAPSI